MVAVEISNEVSMHVLENSGVLSAAYSSSVEEGSEISPCVTPVSKIKKVTFGSCAKMADGKIKLFVATENDGACRVVLVSESDSWKVVCSMIQRKFSIPIFSLYHIDDDGDKVQVDDDDVFDDFKAMCVNRKHKLTAVTPLSPGCDVTNSPHFRGICPEGQLLESFTHSIHKIRELEIENESPAESVSCCSISSDKSLILTGGKDKSLKVWKSSICIADMPHSSEVVSCDLSNTKKLALSGCSDGTISLWDITIAQPRLLCFKKMTTPVTSVKFSPDSFVFAFACQHRPVRILSLHFAPLHMLSGTESSLGITFGKSPGSALFCTGPRNLQLWNYKCGKSVGPLTSKGSSEDGSSDWSCAFSNNDRLLATASGSEILVWQTYSRTLARRLSLLRDIVFKSVAFTWDENIVASSTTGHMTVWKPTDSNMIAKKVCIGFFLFIIFCKVGVEESSLK